MDNVVTIVVAVLALLGGAFGSLLLNRWFDRDKDRAQAAGKKDERTFDDNEHARTWLAVQLEERDKELKLVTSRERDLLQNFGVLSAQMARQEERTNAQAIRIDDLSAQVARLGSNYAKVEAERDEYRRLKHDVDNKLTVESARAQLAMRDLEARDAEIVRLKGQIDAMSTPKSPQP